MLKTETKKYPTLTEAKTNGAAWLAANPAAVEIEYTIRLGTGTMQVWVQRDGSAFDKSQFSQ